MMDTSTSVILSIKPVYAQAIMSGIKKVEFRKKIFKRPVDKIFVYSSSPEQKILGYFTIDSIVENSPLELWKEFRKEGGIIKKEFFNYYGGYESGFSIKINKVIKFLFPVNPKEVIDNFYAPQSYVYLDNDVVSELIIKAQKED